MPHDTAEVYLQIRLLPEHCRPAWVIRRGGATLVAVDPRSTCVEVAEWVPDRLTDREMNAFRVAYAQPLVGAPLTEEWRSDYPFPLKVPDMVRLPEVRADDLSRARWERQVVVEPRKMTG